MSRKMYVDVTVRLIIRAEENALLQDVIQEMDYDFESNTVGADIEDTEVRDYKLIDSK